MLTPIKINKADKLPFRCKIREQLYWQIHDQAWIQVSGEIGRSVYNQVLGQTGYVVYLQIKEVNGL